MVFRNKIENICGYITKKRAKSSDITHGTSDRYALLYMIFICFFIHCRESMGKKSVSLFGYVHFFQKRIDGFTNICYTIPNVSTTSYRFPRLIDFIGKKANQIRQRRCNRPKRRCAMSDHTGSMPACYTEHLVRLTHGSDTSETIENHLRFCAPGAERTDNPDEQTKNRATE